MLQFGSGLANLVMGVLKASVVDGMVDLNKLTYALSVGVLQSSSLYLQLGDQNWA